MSPLSATIPCAWTRITRKNTKTSNCGTGGSSPDARSSARQVLCDKGILLITVPALMGLWSSRDVVNKHFRRYTLSTLLPQFPAGEWKVLKATYFSSLLLPLVWTARKWKNFRTRGQDTSH